MQQQPMGQWKVFMDMYLETCQQQSKTLDLVDFNLHNFHFMIFHLAR